MKTRICNIPGTMEFSGFRENGTIKKQVFTSEWRNLGDDLKVRAFVRFDDELGNGHNDLSVTGGTKYLERGRWREGSCGCIHDEVARAFPEFAHLVKWHLCSTDGPTYYPGNVLYTAGDRDYWGGRKGEVHSYAWYLQNGEGFLFCEYPEEKYRIVGPKVVTFKTKSDAEKAARAHGGEPFGYVDHYHEGKERKLDCARRCAVWPEATDEQLSLPKKELEAILMDRLPALLADFMATVKDAGFITGESGDKPCST